MTTQGFVKGPLGGWEQVATRDGETARVQVQGAALVVLVADADGRTTAQIAIDYPAHGYGGHELLLSAEETYLAMFLYSGQREVGYELFRFRPALEHVARLPYVFGMGNGPAFSDDEGLLALAWTINSGLYAEEAELDDDECTVASCVLAWADVHVRELPDGPTSTCRIDVRLPAGFPFEGDDWYTPQSLRISRAEGVAFTTDWGVDVRIPIPLPESIVIDGPTARGAS